MSDPTLAERLVNVANQAIANAEGDPYGSYDDRAEPAVVAVLRELARHPFELHDRVEDGPFVTYRDVNRHMLRLADEIEGDK